MISVTDFIISSILCGAGLAMDAFSVSMVHGLKEPFMRRKKMLAIAGTFGLFQFFMPLTGWVFVHAAAERFAGFARRLPWISFFLLLYIGGKMLLEAVKEWKDRGSADYEEKLEQDIEKDLEKSSEKDRTGTGNSREQVSGGRSWWLNLMVQAVATSIDALSVGFIISGYHVQAALMESIIIGLVTLLICLAGIRIGRIFGLKLAPFASFIGGMILIGIGVKILL